MRRRSKRPYQRRYMRHPSSMPVEFRRVGAERRLRNELQDISCAGLSFRAQEPLAEGEMVEVRLAVLEHEVSAHGRVAWCHEIEPGVWRVGLLLSDGQTGHAVRMIEQLCHIELYREQQRQKGRHLSTEEAAQEWIARYAAGFPSPIDED